MPTNGAITVAGYAGSVQTLLYSSQSSPAWSAATVVLPLVSGSVDGGSLVPALPGDTPTIAAGSAGLLQVGQGGQYAVPTGFSAVIDTASTSATVFGGSSAGQLVVAGSSGLTFNAGQGAGTVIAGDGNNYVSILRGAGPQSVATGSGDDTVVATFGNNMVQTGAGSNLILAQGGNDSIVSAGGDLISCPDGNAAITLSGPASLQFPTGVQYRTVLLGRGASQVQDTSGVGLIRSVIVVGSGASTISSATTDQIWMQAGGGLVQSTGYVGTILLTDSSVASATVTGYSADTVIGGTGAITVNAIQANDFVFAGPGALQFTASLGASTILGNAQGIASITGGAGSVIAIAYGQTSFTGGSGAATVAAFGGSVTINGGAGTGLFVSATTGNNRITAGTGNTTIYGGGAGDVLAAGSVGGGILVAGSGAETLVGGAGADLFAAIQGKIGTLTVQNFTKGQDFFTLTGFATTEASNALSSSTLIAGSQQLTLSDGTKILFVGVTGLGASSFI